MVALDIFGSRGPLCCRYCNHSTPRMARGRSKSKQLGQPGLLTWTGLFGELALVEGKQQQPFVLFPFEVRH